jgi:hypothetical protein
MQVGCINTGHNFYRHRITYTKLHVTDTELHVMAYVYKESFANLVMWFLVAVFLGWQGSSRLNCDSRNSQCTRDCWTFGYSHVQLILLAVVLLILRMVASVYKTVLPIRFENCFMNVASTISSYGKKNDCDTARVSTVDEGVIRGRWLHEILHIIFLTWAFVFWNYVKEGSDRANMLTAGLPVSRLYVQMWVVFVPTIASEIMAVRTYGKIQTNWFVADAKWALLSILFKLILLILTDVVIARDTQIIWSKADDSEWQLRIVLLTSTLIGVIWMYFWHSVAQACSQDKMQHLLMQSWACVDFPVTIVIISYVAWTVTDRYYVRECSTNIELDFTFQVAYAYALFLGILNTKHEYDPSRRQNTLSQTRAPRRDFECRGDFSPVPREDPDDTHLILADIVEKISDNPKINMKFIVCDENQCVGIDRAPGISV